MTKTVYGLEEAPADFDEHFCEVSEDLCDEFGSLCLTRLTFEPAAFHSKLTSVMMCKHMDDGLLVGPDEALDRTFDCHGQDPSVSNELSTAGVGDNIPRKIFDQDGTGISGQASCKTLRQSVVLCWFGELQSCAFSWCAIGIESSG